MLTSLEKSGRTHHLLKDKSEEAKVTGLGVKRKRPDTYPEPENDFNIVGSANKIHPHHHVAYKASRPEKFRPLQKKAVDSEEKARGRSNNKRQKLSDNDSPDVDV
jgi:hypothetical protein